MESIRMGSEGYDDLEEIEYTFSSDYSGGPVEHSNYTELKKKYENMKGVYDVYGGYDTTGLAFNRKEVSEEDLFEIEGDIKSLSDYPCIDDEALSNYEWETIHDLVFEDGSDFRRCLLKHGVPDNDENLEQFARAVDGYMGWASPDSLDYSNDTLEETFKRAGFKDDVDNSAAWNPEADGQLDLTLNENMSPANRARVRESEKMNATLEGGFAFTTTSEEILKSYAEDDGITLNKDTWKKLNDDNITIESNFVSLLSRELISCRPEGHNDDELVGSLTVPAATVPNFLARLMGDDAFPDRDRLEIDYHSEHILNYSEELLKGTSDIGYLLLDHAGLTVWIDNPNEVYSDAF